MAGEELNEEPRIEIINEFLTEKIEYYNKLVKQFDTAKTPATNKLNKLFRKTLQEVYEVNGIVEGS